MEKLIDLRLPMADKLELFEDINDSMEVDNTVNFEEKRKEKEKKIKEQREQNIIKIYGRKLDKYEIAKKMTFVTEKGVTKLSIESAVDYIIEKFSPIRSQEKLYLYKNGVYNEINLKIMKKIISEVLPSGLKRVSHIREISELIDIDKRVFKDEDIYEGVMNKQSEYLINCKNGVLNMETMELEEHSNELLTTMQVNANWNKEAEYPMFQKFLDRVVPSKENQMVLQEMIGYSITKSVKSKKRIFILQGEGDTGKSTFLNVTLTSLLKRNVRSNIPLQDLEEHKFSLVHLKGKTVNIFADLQGNALKDTGKLKAITGGDEIAMEAKNKDMVFDSVFCKLIFSTNHLPSNLSQDKSDAFYNRLSIIKFNEVIGKDEKDENLEDKLKTELDGIFAWAIEGFKRLIDNKFNFTRNQEIEDNVNKYKLASNSLLQFIEEFCTVTNNSDDFIRAAKIHSLYKKYCNEELEQNPISPENIRKQLETRYNINKEKVIDKNKKTASGRYSRPWAYLGLTFKEELLEDNDNIDMKWAKITEKLD